MKSSFKEIVRGEKPVLIDFHATWCGPCQTMMPIVDEIKNHYGDQLRILKIDVDKNISVSTKYKVRGVPTFLLFKSGEVVWRASGVQSRKTLISLINEHL